jgi:hypothetical protein
MVVGFVNRFSTEEQRLGLDSIYDSAVFAECKDKPYRDLICAAAMDSQVQRYLQVLADCDWDVTWATLVFTEDC